MKRITRYILLAMLPLLGTQLLWAQATQYDCATVQKKNHYPAFYCDCHEQSVPFHFPLDTIITDTTWFQASFNDIRQGLCAYWLAKGSVTFEIYAYCTSHFPSIEPMTVGKDRMKELDATEINEKIEAAGQIGEILTQTVNPYIRVYPNLRGDTGRVFCFPYNQGPQSTCEDILPVVNYMTYVRNEREDVYELPKTTVRKQMGFRWKQAAEEDCQLYITRDSCNGELILGPITLSDSMHLWLPDSLTMDAAYRNYPLYVHASSDSALAGRLTFYSNIKMLRDTVDTTFCEGKYLELKQRRYTRDTMVYDTTYLAHDTLRCTLYNIFVTPPTPQTRTLSLKQSQLPYLFEKQHYITAFGTDTAVITKDNSCTQIYHLTVNHKITTETIHTDTSLCIGKTITVSGVTYSNGTHTLRDTTMRDADTRVITIYTIRFTEPEMEYDTLQLEAHQLVDGYPYQGQYLYDYGTDTLTINKRETCTRIISVTVEQPQIDDPQNYEQSSAPDPKKAYKVVRDGQIYIVRDGQWYNLVGKRIED